MLKTIIYGGHNSRFGFACIEQFLHCSYLDIDTIVLADFDRWNKFAKSLNQLESPRYNWSLRKRNKRQLRNLKQLLVSFPNIHLKIIHNANKENEIENLKGYDLVVVSAFPQIFSNKFIERPKMGVINFHPSWLPRCRGANPIFWTIYSREDFGGLTAHLMQTKIDTGPIISRIKINFEKDTITYDQLYQLVIDHIPELLNEVETFFRTNKKPIKQEEEEATCFRSDKPIHHKIFWNKETGEMIDAKIRAGGAFTFCNYKQIFLLPPVTLMNQTKYASNHFDDRITSGTIIHLDSDFLWIRTQNGYLKSQFEVKKDITDKLMDICKQFGLGSLIYYIPMFEQQLLKPGQVLN